MTPSDQTPQEGPSAREVAMSLTKKQRQLTMDGSIHGDFQMRTVAALRRAGVFHLVIDSPNGRYGFMRLTPLGERVQAYLKARSQ